MPRIVPILGTAGTGDSIYLGALPQVVLWKAFSLLSKIQADVVTEITEPKISIQNNFEITANSEKLEYG
jgi:hypothetical protein